MKKLPIFLFVLVSVSMNSQTWVPVELNTTKDLLDVHFINMDNGWIVGSEGAIFRYYNQAWHEMDAGITEQLNCVFMVDTNNVWMAGSGGEIVNYTSGGFQLYNSPTTKSINDIYMINGTKGWIVGETGTLLVYDGLNWDFEYIEPPNFWDTNHLDYDDLRHIDFRDENFGAVTGEWGSYLEYRNGWKDMIGQNTQSFVSVLIIDTNLVYISGFEDNPLAQTHYIFTHGNGNGFLYFSSECACYINSFKIIENTGWAVISNGNILKFNGSGFDLFQDESVPLNSLALINDTTGWIVGNSGKLLRYSPFLGVDDNDPDEDLVLFPNPTSGILSITGDQINEIKVIDLYSRIIYSGTSGNIDISNQPDGIYLLRITTDTGIVTKKVVKN